MMETFTARVHLRGLQKSDVLIAFLNLTDILNIYNSSDSSPLLMRVGNV